MILCKECKKCGKCGKPYGENSNYAEQCRNFEKKKKTVFEKIKQMNIDEMTEFFKEHKFCLDVNCICKSCCSKCLKSMLEREVES